VGRSKIIANRDRLPPKILRLRQSECYLPKKLCRRTEGDGRMFQAICLEAMSQRNSTRPIAPVRGERG